VHYALNRFLGDKLEDAHESSCWMKALFLEKVLTNADVVQNFLMSEEFEGPHGHYTLEKGLLHVNFALKRFLVDTT
jgi:hypothetical protein